MYKQRVIVLSKGLAGVHGELISGSITYYDTRLRAYLGELLEGGYVVDNEEPLSKKPGLAISSPMVSGSLAPGTSDKLGDVFGSIVAQSIANDPGNGWSGLAQLALKSKTFSGLDFVAPDLYAAWWLAHGAKVGQRKGEYIYWASGEQEEILPFEKRFQCSEN